MMNRRDPLLPNASIVARHEYRDRVRSPLYLLSTVILMGLALAVALTPIGIRYLDRQRVDRIVVVADDDRLAAAMIATAQGIMNIAPAGADPETWTAPYAFERATDLATAEAAAGASADQRISPCVPAAGGAPPGRLPDERPRRRRPEPARRVRGAVGRHHRLDELVAAGFAARDLRDAGVRSALDQRTRSKAARRSMRWRRRAGASSGRSSSSSCSSRS